MPGEGFLRRWSRLKGSNGQEQPQLPAGAVAGHEEDACHAPAGAGIRPGRSEAASPPAAATAAPASVPAPVPASPAAWSPTLEDAMRLTPESDYSAYVAQGVDKAVRRLALQKLFADPHFNQMDGLDIYMGDYNRAEPLPASMLAALRQAQGFLQEECASAEGDRADNGMEASEDGCRHAAEERKEELGSRMPAADATGEKI